MSTKIGEQFDAERKQRRKLRPAPTPGMFTDITTDGTVLRPKSTTTSNQQTQTTTPRWG
jgi:hypothetical protein